MIEPRLSPQWFVKMKPLAEKALEKIIQNIKICRKAKTKLAIITNNQKEAKHLLGKHDFKSFQAADKVERSSIRTIKRMDIKKSGDLIKITVEADGFLYNMVRIIAGTLIEIGKGIYPPEHMLKVLEAKDRTIAGFTAEACGLTFMMVGYDEKYDIKATMEINNNENLLGKAS